MRGFFESHIVFVFGQEFKVEERLTSDHSQKNNKGNYKNGDIDERNVRYTERKYGV